MYREPAPSTLTVQKYDARRRRGPALAFISMRHTDVVWDVDRTTGEIRWKLGGTPRAESLTVDSADPQASSPLAGQHDVRMLADGTLTIHDNDNDTDAASAPRAIRYRIDQQAKTATLLESVSEAGLSFSPCCGSARRLEDGSWLVGISATERWRRGRSSGTAIGGRPRTASA